MFDFRFCNADVYDMTYNVTHLFYRIIVVQSETANDDEEEAEGGTLKPGSELAQDPPENTGVNLYTLAGHENMQM